MGDYEKFCHFEGTKIGQNSVVVDVGSGWNQELSADLENLNMGIKTISLDASLAISPEGIEGVNYKKGENGGDTHRVSEEEQRERLLKTRENSVAAVMPEIPLKDGVADLVVDCYGPATYLGDEKWAEYVSEVGRILKNGGEAHMFPIDNFDNFVLNWDENRSEVSANKRLNLLDEVLEERGLKLDRYSQDDEEGNVRVGVVIKKGI
ncbi:MAG: class I SAM-dependent methyltransferase [Candidatus Shapirobacteria bacterium]